ncbi:hypothetical protein MRX96_010612 [Rhipicephalus microplus]
MERRPFSDELFVVGSGGFLQASSGGLSRADLGVSLLDVPEEEGAVRLPAVPSAPQKRPTLFMPAAASERENSGAVLGSPRRKRQTVDVNGAGGAVLFFRALFWRI